MKSLPSQKQMLQALISAESVSSTQAHLDCSNHNVISILADWLDTLGFQISIQQIPELPGKFNLIATSGKGEQGLVFSGHTDTVPYDASLWHSPPLELRAAEGDYFGLGSCDMKGFFVSLIQSLSTTDLNKLQQPVIVLATADEESTMSGARHLQEQANPLGSRCIIGEPTRLRPVRQHKGIYIEEVKLIGRSGHSSNPRLGNSALEGMHKIIELLIAQRTDLSRQYSDPCFAVPVPTLNLGHIHGGDNANRICGECVLHYDMRLLPGMDLEEVRSRQREQIFQQAASMDLECHIDALFNGVPPMSTPASSSLVNAAEKITGHPSESVTFATEGPFLQSLGMETIILGPGDISVAHKPNEYVSETDLRKASVIYQKMIETFCL